ncbi:unnamed protein product [Dracunculus medinensis]|uniref:Uncharacterized protein n=1 Tax=Dracunculus medinensis TaxID=318479 RepID=A0A0N4UHC5_DRAME|nr:unnamed protein product [Dracunculus medinensis]
MNRRRSVCIEEGDNNGTVDINECFVQKVVNQMNVKRPSPLAQSCKNNNDAFCAALFDVTEANDLQNNANP